MPTEYLSSQLLLATKILSDVVPPWDLVRLQRRGPFSQYSGGLISMFSQNTLKVSKRDVTKGSKAAESLKLANQKQSVVL